MLDRADRVRRLVLDVAAVTGLNTFAGRMVGGRGAILMLHKVTDALGGPLGVNRHLAIRPAFLDDLLAEMRRQGYRFVSMDEAVHVIANDPGDTRPFAAFTADDGYRDNLTEALPMMERHGAPLTIYVAPGLVEATAGLWWEMAEAIVAASSRLEIGAGEVLDASSLGTKRMAFARFWEHLTSEIDETALPDTIRRHARDAGIDVDRHTRAAIMGWDEIEAVCGHPLVTIGAHTISHANLKRLPAELAFQEIEGSRRIIEQRIGSPVRHFAYPFGYAGAVGQREVEMAKRVGFASAVTTRHGVLCAEHEAHLHALPRLSVNGRFQDVRHVMTMLSGLTTPLANRGRRVVTV